MEIEAGRFVQRFTKHRGWLIIKSRVQAWEKMGKADWLATDWIPYVRKPK